MSKTTPQFDFEKAVKALKAGHDLSGQNGILTPLSSNLRKRHWQQNLNNILNPGMSQTGRMDQRQRL